MTKGEYPYPPDEFDDVDPSAGPRGAHRRPRSRWAAVWPYLVALVVSAALAFVVIGFLWDERTGAPNALPTAEVTEPVAPAAPADDPGTATGTPAPTEPEPTASPTPTPVAPDLGTPVTVLNSTSVAGLASRTAEELQDAGWTAVTSGNFPGETLPASTVRYASADLEPSARAVADELGIAAVELAESDALEGIEVVLELDYTR